MPELSVFQYDVVANLMSFCIAVMGAGAVFLFFARAQVAPRPGIEGGYLILEPAVLAEVPGHPEGGQGEVRDARSLQIALSSEEHGSIQAHPEAGVRRERRSTRPEPGVADRRLGDTQPVCGLGDRAFVQNDQKGAQNLAVQICEIDFLHTIYDY